MRSLQQCGGRFKRWLIVLVLAPVILVVEASGFITGFAAAASPSSTLNTKAFLEQHWQRPIPAQGNAPEHYSDLESSLSPQACGTCHAEQLADWKTSLHSRAMGPGLMGQLVEMSPHARGEHQSCIRCHAPLAEQADLLVDEIANGYSPLSEQLAKDPTQTKDLHRQGLVCAACHVRGNQRFGPKRKDGTIPSAEQTLPHNGWTASDAFEDSQFCAACHQFEPNEFSLNGKLLENTYNEWKQSQYAEEGIHCQNCHMPDRKHQWKGIHDPEMVRQGVTIDTTAGNLDDNLLQAQMVMTNTGTGHRFPTYVTPQVVMMGYQENARGEQITGTESYFVVARRVPLNLSHEVFDTRLAPGESAQLDYQMTRHPQASNIVMKIYVEPDKFYEGFYLSMLQSGQTGRGAQMLQEALTQAQQSVFTLYEKRLALP
ncbi:ammonia-forming cytochrome c nitrite reductase subunit c552 [Motiliproteus sp. MSK22-1]|uniref:ammonia-forming cytochrome c nitrite reductase subunit c552 n=1 Tax=Motiliproteus sp. MSK22-1 TaxID=1897630 RepID=UPI0009785A24|nr:ammonia-forming cytochrome c nitrite reductase subunit c552 [Motiliproteus sp. MSK22-1]OMH33753.1 hypothetical protein BGP75_12205 [Motiliproteus sp. MSK22-1]